MSALSPQVDTLPKLQHSKSIDHDDSADICYVRALFPFSSSEESSLVFKAGELIRVLTKLESGWWDGVLHGERGWFPSNYVEEIEIVSSADEDEGEEDEAEDDEEEEDSEIRVESLTPISYKYPVITHVAPGTTSEEDLSMAAFWVPQTTNEGRIYYTNTKTGESSWDLPFVALSEALNSKVIRDRITPIITGIKPPVDPRTERADVEPTAKQADEVQRDLYRALATHQPTHGITGGWRDITDEDIFAEEQSDSDDENGEILLFAMPPASPQHLNSGVNLTPLESARAIRNTFPLTEPQEGLVNTSDPASALIIRTRWTQQANAVVQELSDAVASGNPDLYLAKCTVFKDLVGEIVQSYGMNDDSATNIKRPFSEALIIYYRQLVTALTKFVLSVHAATNPWPAENAAQFMVMDVADLIIVLQKFLVEASNCQIAPRTVRPALLPTRPYGGGWQGNGMNLGLENGNTVRRGTATVRLCTESVVELANLAKAVHVGINVCKIKIRSYEQSLSQSQGSVVLRDTIEVMNGVRLLLMHTEQLDLSVLDLLHNSSTRHLTISDFAKAKQLVYDGIAEVIISAQAMTHHTDFDEGKHADIALVATNAFSDLDSAIHAMVLQAEFLVQEMDSIPPEYRQNALDTKADWEMSRKGDKMRKFFGDMPEAPELNSHGPMAISRSPLLFQRPHGAMSTRIEQTPWFLDHELESDLSYDAKGNVRAGTLLALVERLTRHDLLDSVYNNTILLTYRSFTSAEELTSLLMQRFMIEPPPGLTSEQFNMWVEMKQNPIRLRVLNIFKSWMENFFMEPPNEATKRWLNKLKDFVTQIMADHIGGTPILLKLIEKRFIHGDVPFRKLVLNTTVPPPPPIVPRHMNARKLRLLDLDALEVARQLTIIESNFYNKVKPAECLDKTWSKTDVGEHGENAENIKNMIVHSNRVTAWMAESILYQADLKKRVQLIKHWVHIAERCRALNNFSSVTTIISGLNSAPVHRLRRTWDLLNARVAMSAEDLNSLMNSSKNFSRYREALHKTQPPCVPFLGVYLTDLTFIEDGNPNMSVKARHLINISKRQKTADVIREVQQYQAMPYSLQVVPEIQDYILSCLTITRQITDLYDLSLEREPREREDEKIARLLHESGFL